MLSWILYIWFLLLVLKIAIKNMSKKFRDVNFPPTFKYSSDSDHIPLEFYEEVFPIAKKIDLLLGYFSSNAIKILSKSFAEFIVNGGEIRIITNHILSIKDKENLIDETKLLDEDKIIDIFQDLEKLEYELHDYGQHFFDCLRYLKKENRLTIQPVKFNNVDLAHCKRMILYDGYDYISTDGSINFTLAALTKNSESFEVNAPWRNEIFEKRTNLERENFEKIINKTHPNYRYIDSSEIEVAINKIGKEKNIQDLLEESLKIDNTSFGEKVRMILKRKENRFEYKIRDLKGLPRFPYSDGARGYQLLALKKWVENECKGIFAMATGTGKTITALNCLLSQYDEIKTYKAIILVPTVALLEQWKKECFKFNFKNVITVSSRENWNNNLSFFNTASKLIDTSFVVIVTYASFSRQRFWSHFKQLPAETLFIADEVHNIGAPNLSKILKHIHLEKRIGLSATPNRKYDMSGNKAISNFFNDKPPYIYSYTMKEALEVGWLCKYTYYPHIVYLTNQELEDYIKISKQLLKYLDSETGMFKDCEEVERLLLKRKRIIHKASNKSHVFKEILKGEFKKKKNLKYTLVYVPEGVDPDYSRIDEYIESDDENKLINEYTKIVSEIDDSIMVKQYTSNTRDRDRVIKNFGDGVIDVLTSMKCLDEGVDVPRSELAIFCASTGNPRQFIQRRGRVLRLHDDKIHAVIHDLVVVPRIDSGMGNYDMERNLLKRELERVVDFSELSMNKADTFNELENILDHYNINLNDLIVN